MQKGKCQKGTQRKRTYLLEWLAVMLGGRAAEEVALGEITTGAENDLVEATRLAWRMVTRWGMGSLGLVALDADDEQPFLGYDLSRSYDYGEETANRIDADVQDLLTERFEYGRQLLAQHRGQLDSVMQHLLREEKVNRDALARILGPRPEPKPGEVIVAPRVEEEAATIAA